MTRSLAVHFSDDAETYAAAVIGFLDADPGPRNVHRSVLEQLREGREFSEEPPSFWWVEDAGRIVGAAQWTPPFPLLLSDMPASAAHLMAARLRSRMQQLRVPCRAVTAPRPTADAIGDALRSAGFGVVEHQAMLLQECRIVHQVRVPPGIRRVAGAADVALLSEWLSAFGEEARTSTPRDPGAWVRDMVGRRQISVWEVDGDVVSFAGERPPFAGVVRIGPVYTPRERRNRGYARRLVQEMTANALLRSDVQLCCLFADAANPVSNLIYSQIGYTTVAEHVELSLEDRLREAVP